MKRFIFTLLALTLTVSLLLGPAAARAASAGTVVASAVIVPERASQLGFLTSAPLREISVQQGDAVKAGDVLATLDTPEQDYLMQAAQAAYRSAQAYAELQHSRTVKTKDRRGRTQIINLPREVYLRATALAEVAHTSLEVAQATQSLSTLTAPYDGVIAQVHLQPGQLVQLDQPVLTLATLDRFKIETTDLAERDITKVRVGQKAVIFVDALGAEFPATVTAIAPRADNRGGDVVFKVTLTFDQQPAGLLWGMTAEVTIATE